MSARPVAYVDGVEVPIVPGGGGGGWIAVTCSDAHAMLPRPTPLGASVLLGRDHYRIVDVAWSRDGEPIKLRLGPG